MWYILHVWRQEKEMHIKFWLRNCMQRNHSEGLICRRWNPGKIGLSKYVDVMSG
jgi:hypothetical protein